MYFLKIFTPTRINWKSEIPIFKFSKLHGPLCDGRQGYGDGKTQQRPNQDILRQLLFLGLFKAKNLQSHGRQSTPRPLSPLLTPYMGKNANP